jgi:hypothetical protein
LCASGLLSVMVRIPSASSVSNDARFSINGLEMWGP